MASKRRIRRRSCEGKIRYDNKNGTYRTIRKLTKESHYDIPIIVAFIS